MRLTGSVNASVCLKDKQFAFECASETPSLSVPASARPAMRRYLHALVAVRTPDLSIERAARPNHRHNLTARPTDNA